MLWIVSYKIEVSRLFQGRFLNVHLGLSPYYRGSGTNVWPLINKEPGFVGATFMYLDEGIDTGEIIHQLQAKIFLGDSVHSIGNRLIKDMTYEYIRIIVNFRTLTRENQFTVSNSNFYKRKDFDKKACEKLYQNFSDNLILKHLETKGNLGIKTIQNRGMFK